MKKKSLPIKILLLFSVLFLPSLAYLIFQSGHNNYKRLEILGDKEVDSKGDTVYHAIPDFSFTDQQGRVITQKDFDEKIYVADFFFTTCPTICPKMSFQMKRIHDKFIKQDMVKLISHSINPYKDSTAVLAEYASLYGANPDKWHFVSGDKQAIYDIAKEYMSFAGEGQGDGSHGGFIHTPYFVLVDKEKRIRAYCDGTNPAEVDTLMDKVKVLLAEYVLGKKEK